MIPHTECAGKGCDDCAGGVVRCDECDRDVPAIGLFDPNTGQEPESFEIRFLVLDSDRPTTWVPLSCESELRESCARQQLRIIERQIREMETQALCVRHRDELLRGPSAEDLRDARGDLAYHESR